MLGMRGLCSGWASIDGEPVLPSVAACYRRYVSYLPNNIGFEDITVEQLAKSILTGDSKYSSKEAERHLQLLGVEPDCLHRAFASLDASTAQRAALLMPSIACKVMVRIFESEDTSARRSPAPATNDTSENS